jgi:hypothetical protein
MANEFFNINTFRQKLNGGSKANLFRIEIEPDTLIDNVDLSNLSILCKSGAIPAFTLGIIEVPFRGRRIKIPGDRTYADWTATFVNDDSQNIRKSFDNYKCSLLKCLLILKKGIQVFSVLRSMQKNRCKNH